MPIHIPQTLLRPTRVILIGFGVSSIGYVAYRWNSTSANKSSSSLNPSTFTPFTLASKEPISSTSAVFTLRHESPQTSQIIQEIRNKACIWSVQAKQPQLQIARSYTPLPPSALVQRQEESDGDIRFLIRRERNGEVSTYLHNLPLYSTMELRGPYVELEIPETVTDIVFLAGGTGIAPAMQVADIITRRGGGARCQILWANRRREECVGGERKSVLPGRLSGWKSLFGLEENVITMSGHETMEKGLIVRELEALKERATGKIDMEYFVDEESDFIESGHVLRHLRLSLKHNEPGKIINNGEQKLILVSGPDGFVEHWAGKKIWVGGHEAQGLLGGVLSRLDLKDWKVWKL